VSDPYFLIGLAVVVLCAAGWIYAIFQNRKTRKYAFTPMDKIRFPAVWQNEFAATDLDPRAHEIFEEDPYYYDFVDPKNPANRRGE